MPKDIGAANRTRPLGATDCDMASASTVSPSARMRAALTAAARPMSVSERRREVRFSNEAPIRASSRPMALETVALDRPRSVAARTKEPVSATLANTAQASRSGRRGMVKSGNGEFPLFLFLCSLPSPILGVTGPNGPTTAPGLPGAQHDQGSRPLLLQ